MAKWQTNGKPGYSRNGTVVSVERFLDVDDGKFYFETRVRRFDIGAKVGYELIIVTEKRMFRKGQIVVMSVKEVSY